MIKMLNDKDVKWAKIIPYTYEWTIHFIAWTTDI